MGIKEQTKSFVRKDYESTERAVIRFLEMKGYETANTDGVKTDLSYGGSIGILNSRKTKEYLRGLIKRPLHIANLHLYDQLYKGDWGLEVFGEENIPQAKELANKLSSTFDKRVQIELVSESPKYVGLFAKFLHIMDKILSPL